jgi:hypothetical protein
VTQVPRRSLSETTPALTLSEVRPVSTKKKCCAIRANSVLVRGLITARSASYIYDRDVQPLYLNGEMVAYQFPTWDEPKLRMFALSLLWRAAVTTNYIFSMVSLGPHLARLGERIVADNPGPPEDFSVIDACSMGDDAAVRRNAKSADESVRRKAARRQ